MCTQISWDDLTGDEKELTAPVRVLVIFDKESGEL